MDPRRSKMFWEGTTLACLQRSLYAHRTMVCNGRKDIGRPRPTVPGINTLLQGDYVLALPEQLSAQVS